MAFVPPSQSSSENRMDFYPPSQPSSENRMDVDPPSQSFVPPSQSSSAHADSTPRKRPHEIRQYKNKHNMHSREVRKKKKQLLERLTKDNSELEERVRIFDGV